MIITITQFPVYIEFLTGFVIEDQNYTIMNQTEFNKKERFDAIIKEAKEKQLGYQFVLEEVKRNKWNVNAKQVEQISTELQFNNVLVLFYALDINVLNVDNKTRKAIIKQRKNKEEYV